MSKHFSYLVDDESGTFFQKVAAQEAGIAPARAAPPEMEKQASFASEFEKVASRLDQHMGIIKAAGQCGLNGGMEKRAGAYLDALLNKTSLSPGEFSDIFDKVAAEAIQVDLEAAYAQACSNLPVEYHGEAEQILMKCGSELVKLSQIEKEAIAAFLGRVGKWVSKGRGVAKASQGTTSAVGRAAHAAGKPIRSAKKSVDAGLNKVREGVRKGKVSARNSARANLAKLEGTAANMTGKVTNAQRAGARAAIPKAKAEIGKIQGQLGGLQGVAKAQRETARWGKGGSRLSPTRQAEKTLRGTKSGVPKELAGTTAVGRRSAAASKATTTAKKNIANIEREGIKAETAAATKVTPPKTPKTPEPPKATKPGTPDAPKTGPGAEAAADAAAPTLSGISAKWKAGEPLTQLEKRHAMMQAAKGVVGYRVIAGKGALSGGEGLV